jgi:hypothetical protein
MCGSVAVCEVKYAVSGGEVMPDSQLLSAIT